jgi:hypothetical protein
MRKYPDGNMMIGFFLEFFSGAISVNGEEAER